MLAKGQGCTLWDIDGKAYTDFVAGIAVCNLGHAHPEIAQASARQAETLLHVSNLYYTIPQMELAAMAGGKQFCRPGVFLQQRGRGQRGGHQTGPKIFPGQGENERFRIITMEQSFHGRTMATLSATGQEKIRKGFDPVLRGFDFVPFNDIEALEKRH